MSSDIYWLSLQVTVGSYQVVKTKWCRSTSLVILAADVGSSIRTDKKKHTVHVYYNAIRLPNQSKCVKDT